MMELKDLPMESQFYYRTFCDELDTCNNIEVMRTKFKEILLEHLKNKEATNQFLKNEFKKR